MQVIAGNLSIYKERVLRTFIQSAMMEKHACELLQECLESKMSSETKITELFVEIYGEMLHKTVQHNWRLLCDGCCNWTKESVHMCDGVSAAFVRENISRVFKVTGAEFKDKAWDRFLESLESSGEMKSFTTLYYFGDFVSVEQQLGLNQHQIADWMLMKRDV